MKMNHHECLNYAHDNTLYYTLYYSIYTIYIIAIQYTFTYIHIHTYTYLYIHIYIHTYTLHIQYTLLHICNTIHI